MKKFRILALVLVLVLAAGIFASCGAGDALSGTMTIVVREEGGDKSFSIDLAEAELTTKDNVTDAMRFLARKGDNFVYSGSESIYGLYLTSICGLSASSTHYIAVLTSVEADKGTFEGVVSLSAGGKTCYSSGVGVSSMTLEDGAVILFVLEEIAAWE